MKGKHLNCILWLFLFSGDLYGEADSVNYQKKRSHFFSVDFTYDIFGKYARQSELHGHFKYGVKLAPRHTVEIGAKTPILAPIFITKYSYDLIKRDNWIFGVSASVLLGLNYYEDDIRCGEDSSMCFGVSVNFFAERLILENMSILVRVGIGPPAEGRLTPLSNLNLSTFMGAEEKDETFFIGLGGRYYFH